MKREEWLQDLDTRQRNVVFPDTALNEARFWRNIYESKVSLSATQKTGLAVMGFLALCLILIAVFVWRISVLDWVFGAVLLGCFLLLLKWSTGNRRRRT